MHRTYAGIVQAGTNREGLLDLSVVVLHHEHLRPMQDAGGAPVQGGGGVVGVPAVSAGLGEHDFHAVVVGIVVDGAGGIAASADACEEIVGVVAARLLLQLPLQLLGDNALHACHQVRIGVRTHC